MPDRNDIKVGDRIAYSDPSGVEDEFTGTVFEVMSDASGAPASAVIECDNGQWAALDLGAVTIRPLREVLN